MSAAEWGQFQTLRADSDPGNGSRPPGTTDLPVGIRDRFEVFSNLAYLNSCSQGALSDSVRNAYGRYLDSLAIRGALWDHWVGRQDAVRSLLARLLNAHSSEIAVTTSGSAAVSALASALDFGGQRDTVVTTDLEFPMIGQIWHAQQRRGARVIEVRSGPDNLIPLGAFERVIDDRTAIVSITHVCFRNGARTDLGPVIELAHARGARVLVDTYQSIGAIPVDAPALGADFVTGGCMKYLLSSPGVGFMYARPASSSELIPTSTGWFAARDIDAMDGSRYDPAPDARRFESGTPPIPCLYAAEAGVGLMLEIGVDRAMTHNESLLAHLRSGLEDIGARIVTPAAWHGPMMAVASSDEQAAVALLEQEGIVVSARDGNIRISVHCYNNDGDIEAVLAALHRHRYLL